MINTCISGIKYFVCAAEQKISHWRYNSLLDWRIQSVIAGLEQIPDSDPCESKLQKLKALEKEVASDYTKKQFFSDLRTALSFQRKGAWKEVSQRILTLEVNRALIYLKKQIYLGEVKGLSLHIPKPHIEGPSRALKELVKTTATDALWSYLWTAEKVKGYPTLKAIGNGIFAGACTFSAWGPALAVGLASGVAYKMYTVYQGLGNPAAKKPPSPPPQKGLRHRIPKLSYLNPSC